MAPFKLKFRMGSSRSTSQEHDPDPQVNEALLNHHSTAIGASNSTIDSADCNSLGSLGTNERKSLLPSKSNNLRLGYINHSAAHGGNETAAGSNTVPTTPPPLYEHVLEENSRLSSRFDLTQKRQLSGEDSSQHSQRSSSQNLRNSANLSPLEQLSLSHLTPCTDPDCRENYANNEQRLQRQQEVRNDAAEHEDDDRNNDEQEATRGTTGRTDNESDSENRKKSIDSTELLISTNMTAPSSQEHLLDGCTSECQQYDEDDDGACDGACGGGGHAAIGSGGSGGGSRSRHDNNGDFCDPLLNHNGYCNDESHYGADCQEHHSQQQQQLDGCGDTDGEDGWDRNPNQCHSQQQQQHHQQQQLHTQQDRSLTPEIISNKSSKEIYKDLAKQWGITCKMSDGCRCMECQSHYFDCEFDDNEHQKTDGGLGAGTPMFISEVMHGSACQIL